MKDKNDTTLVEPENNPILPDNMKDYDNPLAEVTVDGLDALIGRIFTHTELLGLPERQLSAYKAVLRKLCWDWYNNHFTNPHGLADVSRQARIAHGIEPNANTTTTYSVSYNAK